MQLCTVSGGEQSKLWSHGDDACLLSHQHATVPLGKKRTISCSDKEIMAHIYMCYVDQECIIHKEDDCVCVLG